MSDYVYTIVNQQPPKPCIGPLLWLRSWIKPVYGWTHGSAAGNTCRREWVVRHGYVRMASESGLVHTCGESSRCGCTTERQFRQEDRA